MVAKLSRYIVFLGPVLLAGCGGSKGTIQINVVTSPIDDPFKGATQVTFTVGPKSKTVPVIDGHYEFSLDQEPPKTPAPITVRVLDAADNTLGYGATPTLSLQAVDQGPFAVWVGRPGTVAAALAKLPSPRTEMAAVGAAGLGVLFAGGRDGSGALKSSAVYNVFTHSMFVVTDMSTARGGAVAIASPPRATVFGGSQGGPFGSTTGALGSAELFDPSTGTGLWAAVPADSTPEARSFANILTLGSGSGLVTGGAGESGAPLASALLIATGGTARLTPVMSGMQSARLHHCGAAARFPEGDGALLIGGLADGDPGPVLEKFVGQNFTSQALDPTGIKNVWDATATAVSGGVILVGGSAPSGGARTALNSVTFIPTDISGPPVIYDGLLSSPRAGHTTTKIGEDLLICGGVDDTGAPIASCDFIGTNPVVLKTRIATGVARTGHVAVALETGPVLLAGGVGADGQPLDSIEIYTPAAPAP